MPPTKSEAQQCSLYERFKFISFLSSFIKRGIKCVKIFTVEFTFYVFKRFAETSLWKWIKQSKKI